MKKKIRIGCMLSIILLCFCACGRETEIYLEEHDGATVDSQAVVQEETEQLEMTGAEDAEALVCYVYICGAVRQPGVYALPEGSRIYEVIQAAGGLANDADLTMVNQAETVTDGMMIRIYTQEEAEAAGDFTGAGEGEASDGKVNINTATAAELMEIPGIGSAKATAILAYREEHGDFSSIEELMNIPGIKDGIFQQMKEHIKVNK